MNNLPRSITAACGTALSVVSRLLHILYLAPSQDAIRLPSRALRELLVPRLYRSTGRNATLGWRQNTRHQH